MKYLIKLFVLLVFFTSLQAIVAGDVEDDAGERRFFCFRKRKADERHLNEATPCCDVLTMRLSLTETAYTQFQNKPVFIYPDYPDGDRRALYWNSFYPWDEKRPGDWDANKNFVIEALVKWTFKEGQTTIRSSIGGRYFTVELPTTKCPKTCTLRLSVAVGKEKALEWTTDWVK